MKRSTAHEPLEDLIRKLLLFVAMIFFLIIFGTFGYVLLLGVDFSEGLRLTVETIALLHTPEEPAVKYLHIFLALFGVIITWWVLWTTLDIILTNDSFAEYIRMKQLEGRLQNMKHHFIIAGGGRVGAEMAERLSKKKVGYVIIELDVHHVRSLRKDKHPVIHGDATDQDMLRKAHVSHAKGILLTLPQAEKNLLVALVAKELKPDIIIHARADTADYVSVLKKAGATTVVVPEIAAVDAIMRHIE